MISISYGCLPTRSYFVAHLGPTVNVAGANAMYSTMQASLRKHGPNTLVLDLLRACGFTWAPELALPDAGMQEAVDSVAAALDSPSSPVAGPSHSAAKSAAPSGDTTTTGDAGGLW